MYEGGQMYTPTNSVGKEKPQENIGSATEEDGGGEAGAKSSSIWDNESYTGWGD